MSDNRLTTFEATQTTTNSAAPEDKLKKAQEEIAKLQAELKRLRDPQPKVFDWEPL